jgi:Asp-tRNA(Asn)/Glu-tRNA(Gln) amidotransferase A subunit family amidase
MVGYDPRDPITAFGVGKPPRSYAAGLKANALKGARIGVMANLYGKEERHAEVNKVMEQVIKSMEAQGASVVRFTVPEYDKLAPALATDRYEARTAMEQYFAELGTGVPVTSFRQLVDSRTASPDIQKTMEAEIAIDDGLNNQTYKDRTLSRDKLRLAVASKMAELELDAILYPLQKIIVAPIGQPNQPERNGTLSNGTGFPAVTFPGGFTTPTATAPLGVPVGAELLGRDYSEPLLLSLAYSFEQTARTRKAPLSTPTLKEKP